jgi:hypothetical protein
MVSRASREASVTARALPERDIRFWRAEHHRATIPETREPQAAGPGVSVVSKDRRHRSQPREGCRGGRSGRATAYAPCQCRFGQPKAERRMRQ